MKLADPSLVVGALALLLAAHPFAQAGGGQAGAPARPAITTLSGDVLDDWDRQRELIVNITDAMPEDKFGYKSTTAQRDFRAQVMHIVQVNQTILGTLRGKTPAPMINMQAMSKADVLNAVRQSYDYGAALLREFNDTQLLERVTPPRFMGTSASRVRLAYGAMVHTNDVYGQLVVYLRLNGIVPPASRRGGL
jgi:uncharacterized damage-inducible protein DinB